MPPEYTFVPWLRRGVAAEISAADRLGASPELGPAGRTTLPVELTLGRTLVGGGTGGALPTVRRDVAILGPGDVASIKADAFLRSQPLDRSAGATPGELAFVEFYDEDFPWRYTPARASGSRLRPWIVLLVLEEGEFELRERQGALPVLAPKPATPLPPVRETWAWAHAQVTGHVAAPGAVDQAVRRAPDHALSRLMSPRRLLASKQYHAFVVPAFEAGRLAGLGRDPSAAPAQKPAWGTPAHQNDRDLPVYHRFSFRTGTTGDFETLARALRPERVGQEFGKRPLDVADPGFGVTRRPGAVVQLEGALAPLEFDRVEFPASQGRAITREVGGILDSAERHRAGSLPDDPLVVPPIYGRWHAGVPTVVDAASRSDLAWLVELNLDLRSRAAAGLGAEVVRERQEELVQRAWEQVGRVEEANQRLREAELARSAGEAIFRKHVVHAGHEDRILVLTAAAQPGVSVPAAAHAAGAPATQSVRGAVDASAVPAAAQSPEFRRITRPQRPLMRRLTGARDVLEIQGGLLTAMNDGDPESALSAAPPAGDPAASVEFASVQQAVQQSAAQLAAKPESPDRVFVELVRLDLRVWLQANAPQTADQYAEQAFRNSLTARVDARYPPTSSQAELDLAGRVKALVDAITILEAEGPEAAIVTVTQAAFVAEFGDEVIGKAYCGLKVLGSAPPAGEVARMTAADDVQQYANKLVSFGNAVAAMTSAEPKPPEALPVAPDDLAGHVLAALEPARTIGDRLAGALPVIADRPPEQRLAPVMAHPEFRDPLFEPLRQLSQDYVIPNVADLPRDSLAVMKPNPRFIESYLAGANHAFAQELLWREYPTDQRGTYFKVFWDTRDALDSQGRDDIGPIDGWAGQLGDQAPLPAGVLVLVVRGELLEKYPSTVIYAQQARWPGTDTSAPRELDPAGAVKHPIFHARLQPDITIVGFDLPEDDARGSVRNADPGWFFVLMERPGEPRFGLDAGAPAAFSSWNDLAWDLLTVPAAPYIQIVANAGLAPTPRQPPPPPPPPPPTWGGTAADMAAILFQSPVLLARHASEMLP